MHGLSTPAPAGASALTFLRLKVPLVTALSLLSLACSDSAASEDDEAGSETDTGDTGDTTTTTTTTTTSDTGEDDTGTDTGGENCPPPDPPVGATLEGEWLDAPAPAGGYSCTLVAGEGPSLEEGWLASEPGTASRVDHLVVGGDDKLYAAGSVELASTSAWIAGIGSMPNATWAKTWTYVDDPHPARALATTDNDRLWFVAAPEHLFAVGFDGELLDGPIEAFPPKLRYMDRLARGDGNLLISVFNRPDPPNCLNSLRMQVTNQDSAEGMGTTPLIFANQIVGLCRDGAGGAWQGTLDLNEAAATFTHYDDGAAQLEQWSTTNGAGYVLDADIALAQNGDLIMALYSPGIVELHRYDPAGTELWADQVADLGNDYGPPSLALDADDNALVAFDIEDGFTLARVLADGSADWAGYWTCGAGPVDARDIAVNGDGIWVAGEEDGGVGFIAQFL